MNVRSTKLGSIGGVALLALAGIGFAGCDDELGSGDGGMRQPGFLDGLGEQCGLTCPAAGEGVLLGNSSISGYGPIDGFFRSVVNYNNVAVGVAGEIDAELVGIQSLFGIADTEITAAGNLGNAIKAKLASPAYQASVVVNARPAKCAVDASIAAEVSARCQAQASCEIQPGMASFQCMGTCNVDVDVKGECAANAKLHCAVQGPELSCMGECSGSCTVTTPVVKCAGTCSGTCSAAGDVNGDGIVAQGECSGTCEGGCEVSGQAAVNCTGKCSGSCDYNPPSGSCEASATVTCDIEASANASCSGRCDGNFVPPSASCDASASCQASAKAEARFNVQCTPPSVEVRVVAKAGGAAQAQVDFLIAQLKARLPRVAAVSARARLAREAGAELTAAGSVAVEGTITAVTSGEVDLITGLRISRCVPAQLQETDTVVANATTILDRSATNAASVASAFGMVM